MARTSTITRCYSMDSVIRGHHVYKQIWQPSIGEELETVAEESNPNDSFAVAVTKESRVVGHLPRTYSRAFWHFINRGGTIKARITRAREFTRDLPQGGLDVPCLLICTGVIADVKKLIKLTE